MMTKKSENPIFDETVDDLEDRWKFYARYDLCSHCRGYGLVHGYMGEPTDCWDCGGSGSELARDARGRFTSLWNDPMYKPKRDFISWLRVATQREENAAKTEEFYKPSVTVTGDSRIYWAPISSSTKSKVVWHELPVSNISFQW